MSLAKHKYIFKPALLQKIKTFKWVLFETEKMFFFSVFFQYRWNFDVEKTLIS